MISAPDPSWQRLALPPLPPGPVIVPIRTDEHWCPKCGEAGATTEGACFRCGNRRLAPAAQALRPGEYRLTA